MASKLETLMSKLTTGDPIVQIPREELSILIKFPMTLLKVAADEEEKLSIDDCVNEFAKLISILVKE